MNNQDKQWVIDQLQYIAMCVVFIDVCIFTHLILSGIPKDTITFFTVAFVVGVWVIPFAMIMSAFPCVGRREL